VLAHVDAAGRSATHTYVCDPAVSVYRMTSWVETFDR
jgi:hypothetical protein